MIKRVANRSQRGQALVEFAMVATILFALLFGIFESGRAFYAYSAVVNAASEGARYGIIDPNNTACIRNVAAAKMVALDVITNTIAVACPGGCAYGGLISVTVNYTFTAVTPYVPTFLISRNSAMTIMHVPSSPGACPS